MLYMNNASYFLPDKKLTVEQAGKILKLNAAQIRVFKKIYQIENIPASSNMSMLDFVKAPVAELLTKTQVDKKEIKYLIHCHTSRILAPFGLSMVREVKKDFQLDSAVAFGTSINNCASALVTLELFNKILVTEPENTKAIIICADIAFTHVLQLIPNTSILADAASAILISKTGNRNKLISLSIRTEGKYSKGIWLEPEVSRDFESKYVDFLASVIEDAIFKANLLQNQIKLLLPHNVNQISWMRVINKLNFPMEKIYLKNIPKFSHCFGADNFINFVTAEDEGQLTQGDYYLMATVGLGATFAAAVFQY